jgi:Protein of unknown function (DUF1573)
MSIGKIAAIFATGVFLFSSGRAISYWMEGSDGPRLECTPLEVDLGDINVGVSAERTFVLRNTGNERLLITDVKSTCQCTVTDMPSRVVQPGQSEALNVTFKASSAGAKHQRVVVQTNASTTPALVLKVTANAISVKSATTPIAGGS